MVDKQAVQIPHGQARKEGKHPTPRLTLLKFKINVKIQDADQYKYFSFIASEQT